MKYKLIILLSLFCITSCTDDLNTKPYDTVEGSDLWNSNEKAQMFVNGLYHILSDNLTTNNLGNLCDDNSALDYGNPISRDILTSDSDFGWNIFGDLRACNQAIVNVEASTSIPQKDKDNLLGQAKLLRAALCYSTSRMYGRLIIIDKVLTPDDDLELPRTSTMKETYDFIIKDLDDAANLLPADVEQGYASKGAAYALKAEVCLQGAAYIENNSDKIDYYEQARIASENLFKLNKYSLDNYGDMFNSFSGAQASNEIILATWMLESQNYFNYTWMMTLVPNQGGSGKLPDDIRQKWPMESFEGWMSMTPSQDLVDAYEVIDADGNAKDWNETSYYRNFRPGIDYAGDVLYKHRDARFYETIVYDSCKYFNSYLTMRKGGNMWYESNRMGHRMMTKTGYIYRKTVYETSRVYTGLHTNWCLVSLRLGRSYMNYAEALLRLASTSKDDGTFLSKAISYINKVRTVHGKLPEISSSLSLAEAWIKYKRERRVELAMEDDRYWCLLRWAKADGLDIISELNDTEPSGIIISEDGKSFEIAHQIPVIADVNKWKFSKKKFLLPVPRSEITTNSKLSNDQNEGWE